VLCEVDSERCHIQVQLYESFDCSQAALDIPYSQCFMVPINAPTPGYVEYAKLKNNHAKTQLDIGLFTSPTITGASFTGTLLYDPCLITKFKWADFNSDSQCTKSVGSAWPENCGVIPPTNYIYCLQY
jgi:hypothetical protein